MDWGTRPSDSTPSLWRRTPRRGGPVAQCGGAADRPDASSDREALENPRRADRSGGPRGDRRLCATMPLSASGRRSFVRRGEGRATQSRPGAESGGGSATAARSARYADSSRASAQFCDTSAGARRGSQGSPGIAGPREPVVDPDLYGGGRGAPSRRLSPRPPPRLSRGPVRAADTCRTRNANHSSRRAD